MNDHDPLPQIAFFSGLWGGVTIAAVSMNRIDAAVLITLAIALGLAILASANWFFKRFFLKSESEPTSNNTPDPRAKLAGEVRRAHRLRNVLVSNLAAARKISYFSASDLLLITPRTEWTLPPLETEAEEIEGGHTEGIPIRFSMMISPLSESEHQDCEANWDRYTTIIKHYHDHGYWDGESPNCPLKVAGNGVVLLRLSGAEAKVKDLLPQLNFGVKLWDNSRWKIVPDVAAYIQENGTYDLTVRYIWESAPKTEDDGAQS